MRRAAVVALVLALAVGLVAGPSLLASPTTNEVAPERESDPASEMVRPTGGESGFWPYLNSRQAFAKRSPINVVVIGETGDVIRLLVETGEGTWERTDETRREADPTTHALVGGDGSGADGTVTGDGLGVGRTDIAWSRTTGATRYAYVDPGEGESGRWVAETVQLHDGTYYGHRFHIRLYESPSPDERWVAIQTHSEHFDWFTLRHRVDGSHAAQTRLETDLRTLPGVDGREDVSRVYLDNSNASDADGWATFVDLVGMALAGLVIGVSTTGRVAARVAEGIDERLSEADRRRIGAVRDRLEARHLLLAGTIVAVVLGVRLGGIALERTGWLSMHGIAAVLYPFVGLGLPAGTYLSARRLDRELEAAVVASVSLAAAIWLDYGLVGVDALPVDVIVQRVFVVVALGLIAGGATRRTGGSGSNALLAFGTVLWVLVLGGTLFGYL